MLWFTWTSFWFNSWANGLSWLLEILSCVRVCSTCYLKWKTTCCVRNQVYLLLQISIRTNLVRRRVRSWLEGQSLQSSMLNWGGILPIFSHLLDIRAQSLLALYILWSHASNYVFCHSKCYVRTVWESIYKKMRILLSLSSQKPRLGLLTASQRWRGPRTVTTFAW